MQNERGLSLRRERLVRHAKHPKLSIQSKSELVTIRANASAASSQLQTFPVSVQPRRVERRESARVECDRSIVRDAKRRRRALQAR
jgi:hypothetical protein